MFKVKYYMVVAMLLIAFPAWSADPFIKFSKVPNSMMLVQEGNPIPILIYKDGYEGVFTSVTNPQQDFKAATGNLVTHPKNKTFLPPIITG